MKSPYRGFPRGPLWLSVAACVLWLLPVAAPAAGTTRVVDIAHSTITIEVFKEGLFSFLADNHTIDAPIASGSFDSAHRLIELRIDAAKMRVLDPSMAPGKRAQVQANMVGAAVLDVAHYPSIAFRSTSVDEADSKRWKVAGNLTLHGQTHPVSFVLQTADQVHFTGSATVRQSAFGITPIRIAGGTVRVKDDLTAIFAITLKP